MMNYRKSSSEFTRPDIFPIRITDVSYAETLNGDTQTPLYGDVSEDFGILVYVSGYTLDQNKEFIFNARCAFDHGEFKTPKKGDVVLVYKDRKNLNFNYPIAFAQLRYERVPHWGSIEGDYGTLLTEEEHRNSFSNQEKSFTNSFISTIKGFRFRLNYSTNLLKGKFAVRGDAVFDTDVAEISKEEIKDDGVSLVTKKAQHTYPNPLNVPKTLEVNTKFTKKVIIKNAKKSKPRMNIGESSGFYPDGFERDNLGNYTPKTKLKELKFNTKNFTSYDPIQDKSIQNGGIQEKSPAEEYVLRLGNHQILIQDSHGDTKQYIITVKGAHGSQFTIIQNEDNSQVRIRDHVGNIVFLEGDREKPRILLETPNRQKVEMGTGNNGTKFLYLRNGTQYGTSETDYGTSASARSSDEQEILMLSGNSDSSIDSRVSNGLNGAQKGINIYGSDIKLISPTGKTKSVSTNTASSSAVALDNGLQDVEIKYSTIPGAFGTIVGVVIGAGASTGYGTFTKLSSKLEAE